MAFRKRPEMAALIDEILPDANVSLIRLASIHLRFLLGVVRWFIASFMLK